MNPETPTIKQKQPKPQFATLVQNKQIPSSQLGERAKKYMYIHKIKTPIPVPFPEKKKEKVKKSD